MLIDFLKTKRTKEDLKISLEVIKEFKQKVTNEEDMLTPSISWIKLEQLEEYLEYMVNDTPLEEDTIAYLEALNRSSDS